MFFFSLITFFTWSICIIGLYYTNNLSHLSLINEANTAFLAIFITIVGLCFCGYKLLQNRTNTTQTTWGLGHIISGFSLIFVIVCFLYTYNLHPSNSQYGALLLIFHILHFLVYPVFLVFLWRAVGASIFYKNTHWKTLSLRFRAPVETALWMSIFIFLLFLGGIFHSLHLPFLLSILIILTVVSFFGWKQIFFEIYHTHITIKSSPLSFKIVSAELTFLVLSFVITVAFVNVLRPIPIGWDDIGVYMNFPKIIANNGSLLSGAGMFGWHLVTATGFIFGSPTLAFFINQIGGILATISIICALSLFLEKSHEHSEKNKKITNFVILPMILGVVYYLMPMTIFQQAKDMKLDPVLMFVSVTALMVLFTAVKEFFENLSSKHQHKRFNFLLFLIAGILTGMAFSIKFTTLIFILASIGFVTYFWGGIFGFFGFCFGFITIFTKANLWSEMFVWMPENTSLIVISTGVLSIIFYILWFYNKKHKFLEYLSVLGVFVFGIGLTLFPWIAKNFTEISSSSITISGLLNGKSDNSPSGSFQTDYIKIYTPEELSEKQKIDQYSSITKSGTSLNEDFSRYFGHENGLNNYLKLPINLTLQKNQTGEFTDITFIFLAFTPVALLFFKTKKSRRILWITGIFVFLVLGCLTFVYIFGQSTFSKNLTNIFGNISLPWGYGVLLLLIGIFLSIADFCLAKRDFDDYKILGFLIFLGLYGLLFWISAFGIVWYGVVIYFLLLLVIGFGVSEFTSTEKDYQSSIFHTKKCSTYIFVALIGVYIFGSALLHSTKNLSQATYDEYKYYSFSGPTGTFVYKSDFLPSLIELNLTDKNIVAEEASQKILAWPYAKDFENILSKEDQKNPKKIHEWFFQMMSRKMSLTQQRNHYKQLAEAQISKIQQDSKLTSIQKSENIAHIRSTLESIEQKIDTEYLLLNEEIKTIDQDISWMYQSILSPVKSNTNTKWIYRVGTFFTYFVNNNRSRFFEDNLITNFQTYFFDKNPKVTAERLTKIGLKYLLIDLNSATIDSQWSYLESKKNKSVGLTERYENLLWTVRDSNFSLVDTDNRCLRLAIDEYKKWNITTREQFLQIAGTNYTSYTEENGKVIAHPSSEKKNACARYIVNLLKKETSSMNPENIYSYLKPILESKTEQDYKRQIEAFVVPTTWFALFKINE